MKTYSTFANCILLIPTESLIKNSGFLKQKSLERGQTPPTIRQAPIHAQNITPVTHPCNQLPNAGMAGFVSTVSYLILYSRLIPKYTIVL